MAPGRKRKPGKRYPCGKRTRQELEKDAMSVALDARRRHFGVTAKRTLPVLIASGRTSSAICRAI